MLRHNTADMIGIPSNSSTTKTINNNMNSISVNNSNQIKNNINNKKCNNSANPLDAMPKQFITSMKKLFDILDDQRTGFVKLVDIERGWKDDGCKGLPHGVIDSFKITSTNGLLTFERFCAGLKLCLLRNQTDASNSKTTDVGLKKSKSSTTLKPPRPPSAPLLDIENPLPTTPWNILNTKASIIHPHNLTAAQRALSMAQLSPDSEIEAETTNTSLVNTYSSPLPPPKPPRASHPISTAIKTGNNNCMLAGVGSSTTATATTGNPLDKAEIRHALQNWQMSILLNEMDAKDLRKFAYGHKDFRGCADGGSSSTTDSANGAATALLHTHTKKSSSSNKRRETRRHTLQNGIDYNILKRLKQFEEEREVLLLGLDAVEKACNLYLQQLANVQEKIKYLGCMSATQEHRSEVQQERLNFQRARVIEVNRNLEALATTWERGGFPMHFNLAIRAPNKSTTSQRNASALNSGSSSVGALQSGGERLRQQNRHLTAEVNLKSDRITLLEREKQALMHELYELKQRSVLSGHDSSFLSAHSQSSPVSSSGLGDADVVY